MLLEVTPVTKINEVCIQIPSSKPETQRALVLGALAHGKSIIYNDLRCSETTATKGAMSSFGAEFEEFNDRVEIHGVGHKCSAPKEIINCDGSGFAFRTMTVISSFVEGTVIISGNKVLQTRIMKPLFDAMNSLGAKLVTFCHEGKAPVVSYGMDINGGDCYISGDKCSQFTTALLLGLPMSSKPVNVKVNGDIVSASYIKQTLEAMKMAGVKLNTQNPSSLYEIKPSKYMAFETVVSGDFTSASYIMAIATLFKSKIVLENLPEKSFQGERLMVDILRDLGLTVDFNNQERSCLLSNPHDYLKGNFEFDVKDCPNILPTLAIIGAFVEGTFRVTGGKVTNHHKSPRIRAIASELTKLGVDICELYDKDDNLDGFEIKGRSNYEGGLELSSWGDHRIFLSLFIASLRTNLPNTLDGYEDVHCSFPDFFEQVSKLGLSFKEVPAMLHQTEPKDVQATNIGWA